MTFREFTKGDLVEGGFTFTITITIISTILISTSVINPFIPGVHEGGF